MEQDNKPTNRKLNSVLFIIVATVANLVIMIALFVLLAVLYGRFIAPRINQEASQVIIVFIFFFSVAGSYFFYHLFVKWLSKKVDMDKYFDPIFSFKRRRK